MPRLGREFAFAHWQFNALMTNDVRNSIFSSASTAPKRRPPRIPSTREKKEQRTYICWASFKIYGPIWWRWPRFFYLFLHDWTKKTITMSKLELGVLHFCPENRPLYLRCRPTSEEASLVITSPCWHGAWNFDGQVPRRMTLRNTWAVQKKKKAIV